MTKKLILAVLALGLAAPSFAQGDGSFKIPKDADRNLPSTVDFVGVRVSSSTRIAGVNTFTGNSYSDTEKLFFSGEGIFYGVEVGTDSASSYVVCFDTGAILSAKDGEPKAVALMTPCFANTTNSAQCNAGTTGSGGGQRLGRHFIAGLYCVYRTIGNSAAKYLPLYRRKSE